MLSYLGPFFWAGGRMQPYGVLCVYSVLAKIVTKITGLYWTSSHVGPTQLHFKTGDFLIKKKHFYFQKGAVLIPSAYVPFTPFVETRTTRDEYALLFLYPDLKVSHLSLRPENVSRRTNSRHRYISNHLLNFHQTCSGESLYGYVLPCLT